MNGADSGRAFPISCSHTEILSGERVRLARLSSQSTGLPVLLWQGSGRPYLRLRHGAKRTTLPARVQNECPPQSGSFQLTSANASLRALADNRLASLSSIALSFLLNGSARTGPS